MHLSQMLPYKEVFGEMGACSICCPSVGLHQGVLFLSNQERMISLELEDQMEPRLGFLYHAGHIDVFLTM
jgi:hypothetical protein